MNRLVAFGCSNTYGQSLTDRHTESWPAQLGSLLNLPVSNNGVCGASVKRIWWDILNFPFKPDDLVIIGWTHKDRWCVIKQDTTDLHPDQNYSEWNCGHLIELVPRHVENDQLARLWYKNFHDDFDMSLNCFALINHIDHFLRDKQILVLHLDIHGHEYFPEFNQVEFVPVDINNYRHEYPKAPDGWHPGPLAFKHFSKDIYDFIIRKNLLKEMG